MIDDEYDASNRLCYDCGCIGLSFMLFFLVFRCVSDGQYISMLSIKVLSAFFRII